MTNLKKFLRSQANRKKAVTPPACSGRDKGRYEGFIAERCNGFLNKLPDLSPEELLDFQEYMASAIRRAVQRQFSGATQGWRLRPSGQKCTRLEALKKLGKVYPDVDPYGHYNSSARSTFFFGDFCEAWGRSVALLAGCELHDANMKVTIPLPYGEAGEGEVDNLLVHNEKIYIVDFKSTVDLKYIKEPYKDTWNYFGQQKVYALSEELRGAVAGMILVFISKKNGRFAEIVRPAPSDGDLERWLDHCTTIMEATEDKLPPKPEWATLKRSNIRVPEKKTVEIIQDVRCSYCQGVRECWGYEFSEFRKEKEWMRDV